MNKPWSVISDDELKLFRQLEEQVRRGLLVGLSMYKLREILKQLEESRK
jgi:hypothetical protein